MSLCLGTVLTLGFSRYMGLGLSFLIPALAAVVDWLSRSACQDLTNRSILRCKVGPPSNTPEMTQPRPCSAP